MPNNQCKFGIIKAPIGLQGCKDMQEFIIVTPGIIIGFFNRYQIYRFILLHSKIGANSDMVVLLAHSSSSQPFGQSASIVDVYTVLQYT